MGSTEKEQRPLAFQKLSPATDVDIDVYKKALDFAFEQDDILNIGITGPYGSGKSSVLSSYLASSKKKIINISLASFEENCRESSSGEKIAKKDKILALERKIINQLIHQVDEKVIKNSSLQIKGGKLLSKWNIVFIPVLLIALTFNLSLFLPTKLFDFSGYVWMKIIILVGSIGALSYTIYEVIKTIKTHQLKGKINIYGQEIEMDKNTELETSYFDTYLNEILYVLSHADIEAVVFEDLDRFDTTIPFERLREINYLINKKKKCLKFIYVLRDNMFSHKNRTKFFDFIIPIVPIIDSSNSYDMLLSYFQESKEVLQDLDENFLERICLYIDDIRVLKNIVNEFHMYLSNISKSKLQLDKNKIFAMIAFKNIFPSEFESLQFSRGYVYDMLKSRDRFIQSKVTKYQEKIAQLETEKALIENEFLKSIEELQAVYMPLGYTQSRHSDSISTLPELISQLDKEDVNSSIDIPRQEVTNSMLDSLVQEPEYGMRSKHITSKYNGEIGKLEEPIRDFQKKIEEIQKVRFIRDLSASHWQEFIAAQENNTITANQYFPLITYLISRGYIDETYPNYMTYFYGNSIQPSDKNFLLHILGRQGADFSYKIMEPHKIIKKLQNQDFLSEETLNFDLVSCLIAITNISFEKSLEYIKEQRRLDFIFQFYFHNGKLGNKGEQINKKFVQSLHHVWISIWEDIQNQEDIEISDDMKRAYMIGTLAYTSSKDLQVMSKFSDAVEKYILDAPSLFSLENPKTESIIASLKILGIQIKKLENPHKKLFQKIYENDLYEFNQDMVILIFNMIFAIEKPEKELPQFFTIVYEYKESPLYKRIQDNINTYMNIILDFPNLITDQEGIALQIINNKEIGFGERTSYIQKWDNELTFLSRVDNQEFWELLLTDHAKKSGENAFVYYTYVEAFNEELISFINSAKDPLSLDYAEVKRGFEDGEVVQNFSRDLALCNALNIEKYNQLLTGCDYDFGDFNESALNEDKVKFLIDAKILTMTEGNLSSVRNYYPNCVLEFIDRFSQAYIDVITDGQNSFDIDELKHVLESSHFLDDQKLELMRAGDFVLSIKNRNYSDFIIDELLENHFDSEDLPYILQTEIYDRFSSSRKNIVYAIVYEYRESITEQNIHMHISLFDKLIDDTELDSTTKEDFFLSQCTYMDKDEIYRYLTKLGYKQLVTVFDGRHPSLKISPFTSSLLKFLKSSSWITSYRETGNMYRVYGKKQPKVK